MTPENRTTLNSLTRLADTPLPTYEFPGDRLFIDTVLAPEWNNRFAVHSALTAQMLLSSHLDPAFANSLRCLKATFDAGELEGDDITAYQAAVSTLASQITREARVALGVPVEPLTPHL
jgi:hypothetical protein